MGMLFTKLWQSFWGTQEYKILIVGLNNAGKTTTLYKLLYNEVVVTAPTIGSNVEEPSYTRLSFAECMTRSDLGGQESSRSSWDTYYVHTTAIIMVIDSTDRERLPTCRDELMKMLAHEQLKGALALIFANKQDLKNAMTAAEITAALNLHSLKDTVWTIQPCCALTGEGLHQGLDWIVQNLKRS